MLEACFQRLVFANSSAVSFTFDVCSSVLSFLQLSVFTTTINSDPQVGEWAGGSISKRNSELLSSLFLCDFVNGHIRRRQNVCFTSQYESVNLNCL